MVGGTGARNQRSPGFHRRVAVVVFMAFTVGIVGSAGAAPEFPPGGNPNVTLDVTPNDGDNLPSPATIDVIGAGFGSSISGSIYQCSFNPATNFDECTNSLARFTSTVGGTFTQSINVARTATALDAMGQPVTIDCDVRACTVQAFSDSGQYESQHHISFAPTGTTTSTSTTTSSTSTTTSTTTTSTTVPGATTTTSTTTTTTSTTVPGATTTTSTTTVPGGQTCFGRPATMVGTEGTDRLFGTAGPDVIVGLGGADLIQAVDGDDTVCGGPGNDTIYGGAGRDMIHGGTGNDRIVGASGADDLRGAGGNDELVGGGGNDQLDGGAGADACDGGAGTNTLANC